MVLPALLVLVPAAASFSSERPASEPVHGVSARGQAVVRLLAGDIIPMSGESSRRAVQRATTIRLADGEHPAFFVEYQ